MLTESTVVDQIIVNHDNSVSFRETTCIFKNGAVISKAYHRSTVVPGDSVEALDSRVALVCAAVWQ